MPIDYGRWAFSAEDALLLLGFSLGCGLAVGWLFYDSLPLGFAIAVCLLCLKNRYADMRIRQRQQALLLQFRDLLYAISSSVSAGRSMEQALEAALDLWQELYGEKDLMMQELRSMVRRIRQSNETALTVLSDLAARSHLGEMEDFVSVYESCRTSGADLVRAIHRATDIIGDRITLERELRTLMAQKQLECRIVLVSPFAVLLLLKMTSPEYLLPLMTGDGRIVSTLALGLIAAAGVWMERMNRLVF